MNRDWKFRRSILSRRSWKKILFLAMMLVMLVGVMSSPAASVSAKNVAIAQSAASSSPEPSQDQITQGQQQYESGQILSALQSWQRAAEQLQPQSLQRAVLLSYVSIAAQDLGDWAQAEDVIAHSLSIIIVAPKN